MKDDLSADEVSKRLVAFIKDRFLAGDLGNELDEDSQLLELGVLTSLNMAILIDYISDEFAVSLALEKIDAAAFKSVRNITSMLCGTVGGVSA